MQDILIENLPLDTYVWVSDTGHIERVVKIANTNNDIVSAFYEWRTSSKFLEQRHLIFHWHRYIIQTCQDPETSKSDSKHMPQEELDESPSKAPDHTILKDMTPEALEAKLKISGIKLPTFERSDRRAGASIKQSALERYGKPYDKLSRFDKCFHYAFCCMKANGIGCNGKSIDDAVYAFLDDHWHGNGQSTTNRNQIRNMILAGLMKK